MLGLQSETKLIRTQAINYTMSVHCMQYQKIGISVMTYTLPKIAGGQ